MIAYRAGHCPRYYVIGLAASRASSFELPPKRISVPVEYRLTHAAFEAPASSTRHSNNLTF